jgi:hypothetical protein
VVIPRAGLELPHEPSESFAGAAKHEFHGFLGHIFAAIAIASANPLRNADRYGAILQVGRFTVAMTFRHPDKVLALNVEQRPADRAERRIRRE